MQQLKAMQGTKKSKLTKLQGEILSIFLISVLMTAIMSLGMTLIQSDNYHNLGHIWWKQFVLGCYIAIPAGFVLVPLIQRAVDRFTQS